MDRRTLLKTGGMAVVGMGFGACASKSPQTAPLTSPGVRPRPANDLVPVNASWDRVIHTTVGLRPFRAPGFRVEPEKLDDKTIIHNYGHGGGGVSLSLGTGYLAAIWPSRTTRAAWPYSAPAPLVWRLRGSSSGVASM